MKKSQLSFAYYPAPLQSLAFHFYNLPIVADSYSLLRSSASFIGLYEITLTASIALKLSFTFNLDISLYFFK